MDQFNLRRIHLVWTSFWKKLSNMVVLNGHQTAAALRNMSMRAKRGGRTECLCSLRGREMDCNLGLHEKRIFNIECTGRCCCNTIVHNSDHVDIYTHSFFSYPRRRHGDHFETFHKGINCSLATSLTWLISHCPASQGKPPSYSFSFCR